MKLFVLKRDECGWQKQRWEIKIEKETIFILQKKYYILLRSQQEKLNSASFNLRDVSKIMEKMS